MKVRFTPNSRIGFEISEESRASSAGVEFWCTLPGFRLGVVNRDPPPVVESCGVCQRGWAGALWTREARRRRTLVEERLDGVEGAVKLLLSFVFINLRIDFTIAPGDSGLQPVPAHTPFCQRHLYDYVVRRVQSIGLSKVFLMWNRQNGPQSLSDPFPRVLPRACRSHRPKESSC